MVVVPMAVVAIVMQAVLDPTMVFPVRKAMPQIEEAHIQRFLILKKSDVPTTNSDIGCVAIPVRKAPGAINKTVRKKTNTAKHVGTVATVYSASSFHCPSCDALKEFVASKSAGAAVVFNYSEPAWIKSYPTVRYYDGSPPDNGQHLRSILGR